MLLALFALKGYAIKASDGEIGSLTDIFLEDDTWKVRWLVPDTGTWLIERKVLIPPTSIQATDLENKTLCLKLTKAQVESSPEINQDEPVSRQMEHKLYSYYGWNSSWSPSDLGGFGALSLPPPDLIAAAIERHSAHMGDPHLRSGFEMTGYHVEAADGELGHLENIIADDASWEVQYLVVSDRTPGKHLLILPETVREISWAEGRIRIEPSRRQLEASRLWNQVDSIDPEYQEKVHGLFPRNQKEP